MHCSHGLSGEPVVVGVLWALSVWVQWALSVWVEQQLWLALTIAAVGGGRCEPPPANAAPAAPAPADSVDSPESNLGEDASGVSSMVGVVLGVVVGVSWSRC